MNLYLLRKPAMAAGCGLVVRAETEQQARWVARDYWRAWAEAVLQDGGGEYVSEAEAMSYGAYLNDLRRAETWLDERKVACIPLTAAGKKGVVVQPEAAKETAQVDLFDLAGIQV